jgi:hypothetical protein
MRWPRNDSLLPRLNRRVSQHSLFINYFQYCWLTVIQKSPHTSSWFQRTLLCVYICGIFTALSTKLLFDLFLLSVSICDGTLLDIGRLASLSCRSTDSFVIDGLDDDTSKTWWLTSVPHFPRSVVFTNYILLISVVKNLEIPAVKNGMRRECCNFLSAQESW